MRSVSPPIVLCAWLILTTRADVPFRSVCVPLRAARQTLAEHQERYDKTKDMSQLPDWFRRNSGCWVTEAKALQDHSASVLDHLLLVAARNLPDPLDEATLPDQPEVRVVLEAQAILESLRKLALRFGTLTPRSIDVVKKQRMELDKAK